MNVVVTDGNERATLAVTRSLGREGYGVVVGAERQPSLAGTSRYCRAGFVYPSPAHDPEGFVTALETEARRHQAVLLIPMSDLAMSAIGAQRARLEASVTIPVAPQAVYDDASDKYRLMQRAAALGLPIPHTWYVPAGDVQPILAELGPYPLIIKPGRSLVTLDGRWVKTQVTQARSAEDLLEQYRGTPALRLPSLIQRRIEGEGQGVFALFDRGRPVLLFAHRRVREKPPSGGVSVVRESIELPQPMTDYAVRLLENVGWHGAAMVEFKTDARSGVPYLMEINGRFWGSLQLAIDAGANFPADLATIALSKPRRVQDPAYRVGVRSRWVLGDVDHLLARLLKSDAALRLPSGYPSRWQCLRDFLSFGQRDQFAEIERWDDCGPARYEWAAYVKQLLGRTT
ncbi:MAG: ATP-grasp domain-containing protein [Nitrospiraceae bacterium]